MAKRMTDTEKWKDDWFVALSPEHKILWLYMVDTCDHAGIWRVSSAVASALIGAPVDLDKARAAFSDRVQELEGGYWWLTRFIKFQYGLPLSQTSQVHNSVVRALVSKGIDPNPFLTLGQGLPNPMARVKDKDKDSLGFDSFWKAYPRKTAKDDARKAWDKVNPPLQACLDALAWQAKQEAWTKDGGQFIPYPATWINRGSWQDEVIKPVIEKRRCAL